MKDKNREEGCRKENKDNWWRKERKRRAQSGRKRDKKKAVEKEARIDMEKECKECK